MNEIRSIIFDLGNVLLRLDRQKAIDQIAEKSALSKNEVLSRLDFLLNHEDMFLHETGKLDCETFFLRRRETLEFTGSSEELKRIWCSILSPFEENIALAQLLAPHYQLGILSNTNATHVEWIEECAFISHFPHRIYSNQIGYMKPRREIYEATASAMKLIPEKTLFIDDLAANVEGARNFGWNAIQLLPENDLNELLLPYRLKGLSEELINRREKKSTSSPLLRN